MKKSGKCPKCAGVFIVKQAMVVDKGHYNREFPMTVATFGSPEAFIFKDKKDTQISAWICKKCGYTELYADDAWNLH